MYRNDIIVASDICKFTNADDTSLFYSHYSKTEGAKILNAELSKIANKLSLNVSKSKLLVFSNRYTAVDANHTNIYINGEKLEEVDHAKYLGALIDNKLNWAYQINAISLKLSKGVGFLAKIRHHLPSSTLRSLYFSFITIIFSTGGWLHQLV